MFVVVCVNELKTDDLMIRQPHSRIIFFTSIFSRQEYFDFLRFYGKKPDLKFIKKKFNNI